MTFAFLQTVNTPQGTGYFIGYLGDGNECQVAVRAGNIQKNIVFPTSQISEHDGPILRKPRPVSAGDETS